MFKTAATKIAHNSTLPSLGGNKDIRPLQDLITAEKSVLVSLQKLSVDFGRASEALRAWGSGEGEDLLDTLSASMAILNHFSGALTQYASHEHTIRDHMKSVRTREEAFDELKRRRKSVTAKAEAAERKLNKMSPEHKNLPAQTDILNNLREEIRHLNAEIVTEEAALGDFKRTTTRAWMGLKFGGLLECCEKGTIAGEFGKLVIAEIPETTTEPGHHRALYNGQSRTENWMTEAQRCVSEVVFSTTTSSEPSRFDQPHDSSARSPSDPDYPRGDLGPGGSSDWASIPGSPQALEHSYGNPPNYLGTPQGLELGHFLDGPDSPSTGPSEPHPISIYPQSQGNRSVDDFGPMDSSNSNAGGGRFATFPVKNASRGYSLRDDPPSLDPSGAQHEAGQSFSMSIAEALGSSSMSSPNGQLPPGAAPPMPIPRPHEIGRDIDEPAPSYDAPHSPGYDPTTPRAAAYAPPPGPPSSQSIPNPWTEQQGNDRRSQFSEASDSGDVQLAYMADAGPDHTHDDVSRPSLEAPSVKQVRFGDVSDVEEELERRSAATSPETQHRDLPSPGMETTISQSSDAPSGERYSGDRFQQRRVPAPAVDPREEERALNAAAAREVSRELDSLNFSPPVPADGKPSLLSDSRTSTSGLNTNPPTNDRAPSPLIPPLAPFARPALSPRPSVNTTIASAQSHAAVQSYAQTQSPRSSQNSLPRNQQEHSSGQTSPNSPLSPRSPPPPIINLPNQEFRSNSSMSSYRTPPEYPRRDTSPFPAVKSLSSSPQIPSGTRTISAAAFKRPQRTGSDLNLPAGGIADTSPLSLKKRLPTSPYPQRPGAIGTARDSSSSATGGRDRTESSLPPPPPEGDDDQFDYISAYASNEETGTPQTGDYGSLGNVHVANSNGTPKSSASGYGEGRFATDLDGGLR